MDLDRLIAALDSAPVQNAAAVATVSEDPAAAEFIASVERIYTERLPSVFPGWESRQQQIGMAKAVASALFSAKCCLSEAGTGAGKALALLGPAVLYARHTGGTVIVSTGTHVLQEQYLRKDIPALQKAIGDFSVALAKGKSNYLCLKRLDEEARQPTLDQIGVHDAIDDIIAWSERTETGDRGELAGVSAMDWARVCADDSCTKARCPHFEECLLFANRRKMQQAQVVICNHAMLMADITVRELTFGMGSLLPEAKAIILDEAHHLENTARQNLGASLTETRLLRILRDLRRKAPLINGAALSACTTANETLFEVVRRVAGNEDRCELSPGAAMDGAVKSLNAAVDELVDAAKEERQRAPNETIADDIGNLTSRLVAFAEDLTTIAVPDENHVVWVDVDRSAGPDHIRTTLHASPVEVTEMLRFELFDKPTVCSSATLTTDRDFNYFRSSVGVPADSVEYICDSPFEYERNAMLYVPSRLPDPKADDFHAQIAGEIEQLLRITSGKAFVLCTSWYGAKELHRRIKRKVPYRCLVQDEAPRGQLLDTFRDDVNSVLFATTSFWEGVDVPGDALSCVILDKLPFAVPSDPVTRAKVRAIEQRGGNAFMHYSVPEAVLKLRQGFGRLIRTQSDRGVVAIMDRRIVEARYGRIFRNSLPPAPLVRKLADVERFFREGAAA